MRTKTQPVIEIDGRTTRDSRPSLVESCDDPSPSVLTTPEREDIYNRLQMHNVIILEHEKRLDELEKHNSLPVTLSGPKGISIVGSWRIVAFLAILISIVTITYIALPYFMAVQTQNSGVK